MIYVTTRLQRAENEGLEVKHNKITNGVSRRHSEARCGTPFFCQNLTLHIMNFVSCCYYSMSSNGAAG